MIASSFQRKSRQIQTKVNKKKEEIGKQSMLLVPILSPNMTSTKPDLDAEEIAHVVKNIRILRNKSGSYYLS
jgi:hypothetical protein